MTDAAGYCLVSSAKRDGMRLVEEFTWYYSWILPAMIGAASPDARPGDLVSVYESDFGEDETLRMEQSQPDSSAPFDERLAKHLHRDACSRDSIHVGVHRPGQVGRRLFRINQGESARFESR